MEKIWFIYDESFVSGPYSTEGVKEKLETGKLPLKCKIWWKGQRDWIELKDWKSNINQYEQKMIQAEEAAWYALKDGNTLGPNTKSELIQILSNLENLSKVRVWKKGQEKWATVYQYNDISQELGITKRKSPRAPIIGEVQLEKNGQTLTCSAATISEGGLGVTGDLPLEEGVEVNIKLRSPLLVLAISARAEVRHINKKYIGLEFQSINQETKSLIIDYVNQFQGPSTQYLKNIS